MTIIGADRDAKSAWFIVVRRDKPARNWGSYKSSPTSSRHRTMQFFRKAAHFVALSVVKESVSNDGFWRVFDPRWYAMK